MANLKTAFRSITRAFGFEIKRYPPPLIVTESEMQHLRRRLLSFHRINIAIDVGGNRGAYGKELRQRGYAKRIISFEPLSEAYSILCDASKEDNSWECRQVALGDRNELAEINVAGNLDSSSFLAMGKRHLEVAPFTAYKGTETVVVKTLDTLRDELLSADERIWLKLDVQGFELNVLRGAVETLTQVVVIETELSYISLYEGQPLFCDMVSFLSSNGYDLVFTENSFGDGNTGHVLQVDALFVRRPGLLLPK